MATFQNGVMSLNGHIINKHGTLAILESSNYVPSAGELIAATDTGQIRVGDGVHTWSNLPDKNITEITSAKSRITALETDNTSSKSRISTLEGVNAGNRLTALETLTGKLDPRVLNSQQNVYNVGWNNMYPRFKNLGTQITAQQYANIQGTKALDQDSYIDLYPGDYWELTVGGDKMYAIIVQVGGGYIPTDKGDEEYIYTWKHLHMALKTGRKYAMNDTDTTAGGYAASKMHTEVMPALTEELEAAIGASHILKIQRYIYNGNTFNSFLRLPKVIVQSKLELFRAQDFMDMGVSAMNGGGEKCRPYALFKFLPNVSIGSLGWFNTKIQDVHPDITSRFAFFNLQIADPYSKNDSLRPVIAHFVLVP